MLNDLEAGRDVFQHITLILPDAAEIIEPIAHADRTARQVDAGAGGNLDHDRLRNTVNTRRSASSSTVVSTRNVVPPAMSISMMPDRSSYPGAEQPSAVAAIPRGTPWKPWKPSCRA
jgi:hypothetical protein